MTATSIAADRRGTFGAELIRLLGPRPGRLAFAARLALICALSTLIAEIYQTPDPALTAYIAFFLNKPDRVESLILDAVLTIMITVIIALVMLLAMVVIDSPFWRVVIMSVFSVSFLFAAFAGKLRPLAGTIALIVGYALDLLGNVQSGELATRALLYAWLFVAIPAGVSVAVNLLLATPPRRLAERAIAERLELAAAMLRRSDERTRDAFTECLREGMGEIQAWLKLAGAEKTSPSRDIAALRQAMQSTTGILAWVDVVSRDRGAPLPRPLLERLAQTLDDMARVLRKGAYPIEIALGTHNSESQLSPQFAELWAEMRDLLARFAEPHAPDPSPAQAATPRGGFFLPDAFSNPEYVRYALKTTAAAMFCYVLYSLLNWQAIHTCFLTCYIVSLGTAAESIEKLTLRILGCLVGAVAGIAAIVYIIPSLTSIGGLLIVVFIGALASAWVAAGSERISYAGFQIAFAFFLSVLQGPSPAFNLTTARDRSIGILLGNLVVYLVSTRLWPVSVVKRIDPAIAAVLSRLSAIGAAANAATRRSLAAQVQAALGNIEQDLDLARYEPRAIRPTERWLNVRWRATHEIGALQGPLLLGTELEPALTAEAGRRLEGVAKSLGALGGTATPAVEGKQRQTEAAPAPGADRPLADMIRTHLERLEDALRRSPP
jgi:multidrug resistance protein MdtO